MTIELSWLLAMTVAYLGLLFLLAYSADVGWLPSGLLNHPLIYALSLGVYATSWSYYGSVGLADRSGFAFLTIYIGVTMAFLLGHVLLRPILRINREHQLSSVADLMAWRYGGRASGLVVTLFMLVGVLPYLSLQIRAFTESIRILSGRDQSPEIALLFCALIYVFTILFGSSHLSSREKHQGLVVAIAFESAFKLLALLLVALVVLTQVYDSPLAFNQAVQSDPQALTDLYGSMQGSLWPTLMLLAFCAAFLLPRQYHMTFTENNNPAHLSSARWLFPLYLLLLNLPIIPVLFAGRKLGLELAPDFYVLGITQALQNPTLAVLVFLGGVSASSAMMIVTTLALSYMCMHYLLLPASLRSGQPTDFYRHLLFGKRLMILAIIAASYGFYVVIELNAGLASQGLISFVAVSQLLPGVLGLLYWQRATRVGLVSGLTVGALVWFALLIWPLIQPESALPQMLPSTDNAWAVPTFSSLVLNATAFVIGSLLSRPTVDEVAAAQQASNQASSAFAGQYTARSVSNYRYLMQAVLGNDVAEQELNSALQRTGITPNETRPSELRLLHETLESSLSGLVGPTLSREILRQNRSPAAAADLAEGEADNHLLELRLESSREQMRGLTRQLDTLRRYQREVLQALPIGVCSLGADGTILFWNATLQKLTGISEREARARKPHELRAPWGHVLGEFAQSNDRQRIRVVVGAAARQAQVNLLKAEVHGSDPLAGQVLLIEDRSTVDTLERELAHSERLASIGRLAAGVAHEIGNPLTCIASITQNLEHELNDAPAPLRHDMQQQADDILDQVHRINTIVRSLLTFSHSGLAVGHAESDVPLNACIQEAIRLVQLDPALQDHQFVVDVNDRLNLNGDVTQLTQVFVNLFKNACEASPPESTVHVQAMTNGEVLEIVLSDQGSGVDSESVEKIFDPFYTTKSVGSGTGLGLALVYSIVGNHGGRIRLDPDYHAGARFVLSFPTPRWRLR